MLEDKTPRRVELVITLLGMPFSILQRLCGLAMAASAGALPGDPLAAQAAPTFARLEGFNSVELLDVGRQAWRRVHTVPTWATHLTVGPSNDRLAFLSWTEQRTPDSDPPRKDSELVVIDTTGKVLPSGVQQVQRYAWCGPGCLVYITGQREEGHIGFVPDGVGMLDVATGRTTQLPAPSKPIAITWAPFDKAAYVKNWPARGESLIYRLDLASRTLEPTTLRDQMFSPTGRYYVFEGEFTDSLVVYETRTNVPVDLDMLRREEIVLRWASTHEDVLLTVKRPPRRTPPYGRPRVKIGRPQDEPEVRYRLYDLERRSIRQTVGGHLQSWAAPGNTLLVRRGSHYQVIGSQQASDFHEATVFPAFPSFPPTKVSDSASLLPPAAPLDPIFLVP